MNTQHTEALRRPRHLFDLPAIAVWVLAGLGLATLRLAHVLDGLEARVSRRNRRVAPGAQTHEAHFVPDS